MAYLSPRFLVLVYLLAVCSTVCGAIDTPSGLRARQISPGQLSATYDYIVVGGGQSGLVVANRLSENSKRSVLVVEYGYFDDNPAQVELSSAGVWPQHNLFNVSSVPQPGMNNHPGLAFAAVVVGGGSTINGMLFDRGAAEDYDIWERPHNPGWGWKGLLPYFKLQEARPELSREFNITWDIERAYDNDPIQANFPDWQWPGIKIQWKAWKELGMPTNIEGAAANAWGAYWNPSATDNQYRRSYSRTGYWEPSATRRNLHLLTVHCVNGVLFNEQKRATAVTIQERNTPNGATTITVKATREIVLCAGWLHTPHIRLQRSGLGPRGLLEEAGVKVVVDLPGVGSNLQDHPVYFIGFEYQTDVFPNPAITLHSRRGLMSNGNKGKAHGQCESATRSSLPLCPSWLRTTAPSCAKAVPKMQLPTFLQRTLPNKLRASSPSAISCFPPSRASTMVEPVIDFNANTNPVDEGIWIATMKYYRRWMAAKAMKQLTPVETFPGVSVVTDKQIAEAIRFSVAAEAGHSCCTAAMAPRELSGVVSPELTVYGVTGLSVADLSMVPIIPATHTCATVYAIAEKVNRSNLLGIYLFMYSRLPTSLRCVMILESNMASSIRAGICFLYGGKAASLNPFAQLHRKSGWESATFKFY
ncbi:unnamed protein product [Cyclocybe aegerita]|uniref:pyranose dehydrogenase (acceptor) n=1 Tax=Cyclocybe aegerita TaxID=1973307 RepID=A0A8S0XRA1_CYCAE|nr:unnamed protein product [Cyclocybe aegerita]